MTERFDPQLLPSLVKMNETWERDSEISLWDLPGKYSQSTHTLVPTKLGKCL